MAKHKLTVKDKMDIRDIIFRNIETQNPKFNYEKFIEEEKEIITEYVQDWADNCLNLSQEVKNFIKEYNLAHESNYGYCNLICDHDIEGKYNYTQRNFSITVNGIWELRHKAPKYKPVKYKKLLEDKVTIQECLSAICREEGERLNLEIQKREREFMDIYRNFKNILYSCKYLEDVGNMIPLPEITKYIEGRLLKQCTTLAPINKESINFVDNYIKSLKSA
jgi:hypothetical protein